MLWLLQSSQKSSYNKIREARRRMRHYVYLDDIAEPSNGDERQVEHIIERREQQSMVSKHIAQFSDCRREVITAYLSGHSTQEIAERLGISKASVRQHKCRGLRTLGAFAARV